MKRLLVAAACLLAACTPPAEKEALADADGPPHLEAIALPRSDAAGNRMEALTQNDAEYTARWCTDDGVWCLSASGETPVIVHGAVTGDLPVADEGGEISVWPVVIRTPEPGAVYVGLVQTFRQMYSGGGGSAAFVTIYEIGQTEPGLSANPVATFPLGATSMIRACFSEEDEAQRAGACHDEYEFVTRVSIDPGVSSGPPRLVLETAAGSFPGRVTRGQDSLDAPPLQPSDLVWAADAECSYTRVFTRAGDAFTPDQPLPACTDYLDP